MNATRAAVEVNGVRRVYRSRAGERVALDGVSLRLEAGQWLALLGPNGSGKSTLLRILATLDAPDAGEVIELGERLGGERAGVLRVRRRLGVVFQRPGLDPILTVRENLRCQAALFGMTGAAARERIGMLCAEMGVADRLDDRVAALSGGLARRVDLARALLSEPELLLLDEATAGLDLDARFAFLEALEQRIGAARSAGAASLTIVMTTHLMDEAERATRVALLHEGQLVAEGTPEELRRSVGGALVRCDEAHAAELERAGLTVARAGREAVGAGGAAAVEKAALELLRAGVTFSVGAPTLGDVYLARTGKSLGDANVSDARDAAGGRKRRGRKRTAGAGA